VEKSDEQEKLSDAMNGPNTCCICDSPTYSMVFVDMCMDCVTLEQAFRRMTERSPESARKWLKFQLKYLTKCTKPQK